MTDNALIVAPRRNHNDLVEQNQAIVDLKQNVFRVGIHFGEPFKGAGKPVLLKPGAEMLCSLFGLRPRYNPITLVEQWEPALFHYRYECELISIETGQVVGSGIGSCNSMEDKYRWRKAERTCPICGLENIRKSNKDDGWYCWAKTGGCGAQFKGTDPAIVDQKPGKVPNEDIYTLVNTIDKMAQKRSLLAATLVATGASAYFTQDIEDFPGAVIEGEVTEHPSSSAPPPAPKSPAPSTSAPRPAPQAPAPLPQPPMHGDELLNAKTLPQVIDTVITMSPDIDPADEKNAKYHAGGRIKKALGYETKVGWNVIFNCNISVADVFAAVEDYIATQDEPDPDPDADMATIERPY